MQIQTYEDLLACLDAALAFCQTLGLAQGSVPGRFGDYRRRIGRLIGFIAAERNGQGEDEDRRELRDYELEYVMALTESMQFVDIVPYLQAGGAELRRSKVRDVLGGPPSPHDETRVANHARNTLFEIVVASKFWRAGQHPNLGKEADVEVNFGSSEYLIECKRPFSPARVESLIEEASGQLRTRLAERKDGARGLIALSYSKLSEGPGFTEVQDKQEVVTRLREELRVESERITPVWGPMDEDVVAGVMLHLIKPFKLRGPRLYVTAQELFVVARQGSRYSPDLRRITTVLKEANRR